MSTLFFVSLRKCQHPCRSFFCCFFLFPPRSPIPPPPHATLNLLSIPPVRWQTHSSGRPCFLPVFPGLEEVGNGVRGERLALCWMLSWPLSTQPLLCNTISPGSCQKRRGKQTRQSISCSVVSWHTAEWTVYIMPYIPDLYHIVGFSRRIFE